jgi:hypothetical protein
MLVVCCLLFVAAVVYAAPKSYQVTGPVLEVTAEKIVVKKGKDNWEIARDATTKVSGDVKVGAKVTIDYKMTATSIEVKETKAKKTSKKK